MKSAWVNRLHKEEYKCHHCDKTFKSDEVEHTWRCPTCSSYICIYAEDEETNTRIVLIRKPAHEVVEGDLVHLPGLLTADPYVVLDVHDHGENLKIALKGYGPYKVGRDHPINCRDGAW